MEEVAAERTLDSLVSSPAGVVEIGLLETEFVRLGA